jgi:hypothetical protein
MRLPDCSTGTQSNALGHPEIPCHRVQYRSCHHGMLTYSPVGVRGVWISLSLPKVLPNARHHGCAGPSTRGWSNRPSHDGPVGNGILALRARRCGLPLCGPLDHVGSVQASWARHARAADGFGEASLLEVHLGHPATRSPWPDRNCASVPDEGEVARPPLTGELRRKCARLTKSDGTTRDRAFSHANFNGAIAGCRGLRGSSWEVRDNLRTEVLRGWARELRWCLGLAPWP